VAPPSAAAATARREIELAYLRRARGMQQHDEALYWRDFATDWKMSGRLMPRGINRESMRDFLPHMWRTTQSVLLRTDIHHFSVSGRTARLRVVATTNILTRNAKTGGTATWASVITSDDRWERRAGRWIQTYTWVWEARRVIGSIDAR
jgi:hypothetical protein